MPIGDYNYLQCRFVIKTHWTCQNERFFLVPKTVLSDDSLYYKMKEKRCRWMPLPPTSYAHQTKFTCILKIARLQSFNFILQFSCLKYGLSGLWKQNLQNFIVYCNYQLHSLFWWAASQMSKFEKRIVDPQNPKK